MERVEDTISLFREPGVLQKKKGEHMGYAEILGNTWWWGVSNNTCLL